MSAPHVLRFSMEELGPLMRGYLEEGKSLRFTPKGTSMLPMLREEIDSVVLSPVSNPLRLYDIPLYQDSQGRYVLHRIVATMADGYICRGDNTYQNECVPHGQIVAVITAFYRGEKKITTDAGCYRLYCRLWCGLYPVRRFLYRGINWLRRHMK